MVKNSDKGKDYKTMIDFENISKQIIKEIAEEWNAQGHDLNGKFRKGMRHRITQDGDITKIEIIDTTDSSYGKILDDGVAASQIKFPFAPARIKGLTLYAKLRMGASDKDAVSIAYAIATKHAKEGMPLPGTRIYSKTGERTKFVEGAKARIKLILEKKLSENLKIWQ